MKLRNPDTGKTTSVSVAGAKVLRARGFLPVEPLPVAPAEKPLEKMKLAELLGLAESTSSISAAALEALQKPGTSKAQVIAAISAAGS